MSKYSRAEHARRAACSTLYSPSNEQKTWGTLFSGENLLLIVLHASGFAIFSFAVSATMVCNVSLQYASGYYATTQSHLRVREWTPQLPHEAVHGDHSDHLNQTPSMPKSACSSSLEAKHWKKPYRKMQR
uniref:Uncharacterized protein n=1 Tax=Romanomermis culicivorax TaxID=13658 RepID=A0A915HP57_ROMCU